MRSTAALQVALNLAARPAAAKRASQSRLPEGVDLVLEIAAGKEDALRLAQKLTGQPEKELRATAAFFIEQVLFRPQAGSYRILGTSPGAPRSELRTHMVLLMQWLHPDRQEQHADRSDIDRTVFIHRVTQAWDDLKNDDRRAAYDLSLREKSQPKVNGSKEARPRAGKFRAPWRVRRTPGAGLRKSGSMKRRFSRLVMFRFKSGTLLSRLFLYFRQRP